MTIDKKSLGIIGIMVLAFWLSFIFVDGSFSSRIPENGQKIPENGRVAPVQQAAPIDDVNPESLVAQLSVTNTLSDQQHSAAPVV